MTMSRQHFQLIADVLKDSKPSNAPMTEAYWTAVVKAFANELAHTNPQFNRTRFLKACGFEQPEVR